MKTTIKILALLIFSPTSILAQQVSNSDSVQVTEAYKLLFAAVDSNDMETLMNISTDKIYCLLCSDSTDFSEAPYMYHKKDFLVNHLSKIKESESYQRATSNDKLIMVKEKGHRSDITIFWTIYKRDELATGHESMKFGIYFKNVNDTFKFAGMETVP